MVRRESLRQVFDIPSETKAPRKTKFPGHPTREPGFFRINSPLKAPVYAAPPAGVNFRRILTVLIDSHFRQLTGSVM